MGTWLGTLLGASFMPHGHCYLWSPTMVWTQVCTNLFIGLAYVSIATTLALLVRRIENIPFAWVYVCFGVFIMSCGLTHFFDIATIWKPIYWADAGVRVLTALASVATAVLIVPMLPKAQALAETARLSDERKRMLESTLAELEFAHRQLEGREAEAQRRAQISEEQFRSLVETMPQLAWLSAPDGTNLYRNSRWAEYTGLSLDQISERGWPSIHDPELIGHVEARWREALATGQVFDVESRLRAAGGQYRWFIARAVPIRDQAGTITRWVGTLTDIHQQRVLREQALETVRMKDEFLATVSHELRTPLNAMLGWARMLRTGSVPAAMRDKALDAVERNAVAQAQLIDDLLDISRIVAGKLRLDSALVNPVAAIQDAIDSVRPTAVTKDIQLLAKWSENVGTVIADAARLQQILWNLLVNAVKFTPRGGQVSVEVARVDGHVEIIVADTGVGIGSDFLPHVFDRFSQEDGSIRRKQGGLGIGLAIVKNLVELHGGTVHAESAGEGRGSTFRVRLPSSAGRNLSDALAASSRTSKSSAISATHELHGLRLLLVEDESDSRDLIATMLARCGVHVTAASDAEHALSLLRKDSFDAIISDIGLPGQDGYTFMETVRSQPDYAKLPAAAITAYARAEDRRRALAVGFHMHVPKPVEPDELIAVVTNLTRIGAVMRS